MNVETFTLGDLQKQMQLWQEHNFPGRADYFPLLGAVEEIGELSENEDNKHVLELCRVLGKLAHHHLKQLQGIRGTPELHMEKKKDAVADIVIFLADYCRGQSFDFQEIVYSTWQSVRQRDFKKFPLNGKNK